MGNKKNLKTLKRNRYVRCNNPSIPCVGPKARSIIKSVNLGCTYQIILSARKVEKLLFKCDIDHDYILRHKLKGNLMVSIFKYKKSRYLKINTVSFYIGTKHDFYIACDNVA